ncbi:unnamed protein product [Dibothriocephalus latus]|uniref:Battenin n=1 Tax=Dibothriocephalus latus TaxID=60516 RepID=A0A3P7LWL5_DIBLA|nr:unnamed protein product [Dibothriocephalus latus]
MRSLARQLAMFAFLFSLLLFLSSVISTWSSGTGAAGIAGSVFYAIVTSFVSPEVTLRATIFVPIAMLFTYLFMLDKPPLPVFDLLRSSPCKSACCPQRTYYTVLSENGRVFEADEPNTQVDITNEAEGELEVVDATSSLDPYAQDTQSRLDWTTKCRLLMSIFPLLMSLALVYFFEYLINQALFELIFFDTSNLTHAQQYRC